MSTEITLCPHCDGALFIDEDGDIATADHLLTEPEPEQPEVLAAGEYRGNTGLKTIDANKDWRNARYLSNSQLESRPVKAETATMNVLGRGRPVVTEPTPEPEPEIVVEEQPAITKAVEKDLKERNLNKKTKQ